MDHDQIPTRSGALEQLKAKVRDRVLVSYFSSASELARRLAADLSLRPEYSRLPVTLQDYLMLLKVHLPELRKKYEIGNISVFGSYARGDAKPNSDLDLLVEFYRAPTLFQFVRLERYLSDLLGVKVDLVMRTALKPEIEKNILSEVVQV
jgi:predicted nucleotidyltransferase